MNEWQKTKRKNLSELPTVAALRDSLEQIRDNLKAQIQTDTAEIERIKALAALSRHRGRVS